jgi:hypothetical protein
LPNDTNRDELDRQAAADNAEVARLRTPGWAPYDGNSALHPESCDLSLKGWLHDGETGPEPGKSNVYDEPNGQIAGYAYSQLGFVPLDQDGGFDAHARRQALFGCDQFADLTCVPGPPVSQTG